MEWSDSKRRSAFSTDKGGISIELSRVILIPVYFTSRNTREGKLTAKLSASNTIILLLLKVRLERLFSPTEDSFDMLINLLKDIKSFHFCVVQKLSILYVANQVMANIRIYDGIRKLWNVFKCTVSTFNDHLFIKASTKFFKLTLMCYNTG